MRRLSPFSLKDGAPTAQVAAPPLGAAAAAVTPPPLDTPAAGATPASLGAPEHSASNDADAPDPLKHLGEIEAFGGAMRVRLVFRGRPGGVLILAPPGCGKSTLVKQSEGQLADADDIVFRVLKLPARVSKNMGEQITGWQDKEDVRLLVQSAAHMALVQHVSVNPEIPVLSGWLPSVALWTDVHPAVTVVCLPSAEWLFKRTNSEERATKGHYVMSREQVGSLLGAFTSIARAVEEEGAGYVLPPKVTESVFSQGVKQ